MSSNLLFIGYRPDVPISVLVQHFDYFPQKALTTKENVNKISISFKLLWEILNYCLEKNIFFTHQKVGHTLPMWRVSFRMLVNISSIQASSQEPKHKSCLVSTKLRNIVGFPTSHYDLKSQCCDRRDSSPGMSRTGMSRKKRVSIELCSGRVSWPPVQRYKGYGLSPVSPVSVDTTRAPWFAVGKDGLPYPGESS